MVSLAIGATQVADYIFPRPAGKFPADAIGPPPPTRFRRWYPYTEYARPAAIHGTCSKFAPAAELPAAPIRANPCPRPTRRSAIVQSSRRRQVRPAPRAARAPPDIGSWRHWTCIRSRDNYSFPSLLSDLSTPQTDSWQATALVQHGSLPTRTSEMCSRTKRTPRRRESSLEAVC